MGNCVIDWVFRRPKFCCCLPVRLGAAILSGFTMILAGLLSIVLWFEVKTNYFMSGREKAAFIVVGLVETFLFIASMVGFIGTCARKQSFITAYATFLLFHLLLNISVAAYFLFEITSAANDDIVKLCEEGLTNDQTENQCSDLLNITKAVYWIVALVGLGIEAYCTIVVGRYVHQLRTEKRDIRRSRILKRQSAYDAFHARFAGSSPTVVDTPEMEDGMHMKTREKVNRYSAVSTSEDGDVDMDREGLMAQGVVKQREFDPYVAYEFSSGRSFPDSGTSVGGFGRGHLRTESRTDMGRSSFSSEVTLTPEMPHAYTRREASETQEVEQERTAQGSSAPSTPLSLPPGAAPNAMRPGGRDL